MRLLSLALLGGLMVLGGCGEEPAVPPVTPPEPTVKAAPAGPMDAPAASQTELDAMASRFEALKAAAAAKGAEAEAAFAQMKESFDAKLAEAKTKLDEFNAANAPRTEQIRQDLASATSEAGAILKDAWARFGAGEEAAQEPAESAP